MFQIVAVPPMADVGRTHPFASPAWQCRLHHGHARLGGWRGTRGGALLCGGCPLRTCGPSMCSDLLPRRSIRPMPPCVVPGRAMPTDLCLLVASHGIRGSEARQQTGTFSAPSSSASRPVGRGGPRPHRTSPLGAKSRGVLAPSPCASRGPTVEPHLSGASDSPCNVVCLAGNPAPSNCA